jgi:ketosteroid isomerase-like protein
MPMKVSIGSLLGTLLVLGSSVAMDAQGEHKGERSIGEASAENHEELPKSAAENNTALILEIFKGIERRDERRFRELVAPDFEIHWPASLPYGGTTRGNEATLERPTWGTTWDLLQPTEAERKMDASVVAAKGNQVVVLWHQRGVSSAGERFDGEVLGLYQFRQGKLARAQMFYFDTAAVANFLAKALDPEQERRLHAAMSYLRTMPENRRGVIAAAYRDLESLPHDRYVETLNSEEFKATFSDEERNLLKMLLAAKWGETNDGSKVKMNTPKP